MEIATSSIKNFTFSGHNSFQCRQLWLKKGYDYIIEENSFTDEKAVVKLGVGKNMVSAIRFWLKAFNVIDGKDNPTEFGFRLFDHDDGYDPFLEDEASLWLLHYQLIKNEMASIYSIIFNNFRKEKLLFDKEIFINYLKRIQDVNPELSFNENTVNKDFNVFVNMYKGDSSEIEDSFSGILSELDLLTTIGKGKEEKLQIENNLRNNLPDAIVLFIILDNPNYGNPISLNALEFDKNGPASIFALNRTGLLNKITDFMSNYKNITFTDHAGIKELQFKNKPDKFSVLDKYYGG
ncbi:MAG: DUF4007 family protein [Flavobacteriaceae bacterium]|nr:DUF4007 family protein [Flavobacteriaceae bacterium]